MSFFRGKIKNILIIQLFSLQWLQNYQKFLKKKDKEFHRYKGICKNLFKLVNRDKNFSSDFQKAAKTFKLF